MLPDSWKREIKESIGEAAASESNQRKTEQNEAGANIASAINALRDAQTTQTNREDANEKRNQAINKATLVLVAFTVLFTGLSWYAFREQVSEMKLAYGPIKKSADVAQDTLVATQRPWVSVKVNIGGPLTSDEEGLHLPLTYVLKNTGNTPALEVEPQVMFYANTSKLHDPKPVQKRVTDFARGMPADSGGLGFSGFPLFRDNEPTIRTIVEEMRKRDIDRALAQSEFADKRFIRTWIVGCVDYRTTIDGKHHQTGFIFELHKIEAIGMRMIDPTEPKVEAAHLHLTPWPSGFYAD